ncbi:hypothetical protein C0V82_26620 (plasmid) [Niveispirillum cyanobacteriorum]|uniref:Transposase DDE domain-containing protein n=1 Tax=Niveispirillum cyanobacteriorum TaxID=1612173 RepID=A0A2K9NLL7_9PROT|nr:hypothetical protein C0V82_26620 [Niveispirillum cyanobacteriorum]
MQENTQLLPGLSLVSGKSVEACFDGGSLSSDAGVLALREIDMRLNVAAWLAARIADTELMVWMPLHLGIVGFQVMVSDGRHTGGHDGGDVFAGDRPGQAAFPGLRDGR